MQPKVLVALDFLTPTPRAVVYAVKLASRLCLPLVFLGVAAANGQDSADNGTAPAASLQETHQQRLEQVVRQCQEEGVVLEIFIATGPFFEEIGRMADSWRNFQFLVMGVPQGPAGQEMEGFSAAMKSLRQRFPGEILLVRDQEKVAPLTDGEEPN